MHVMPINTYCLGTFFFFFSQREHHISIFKMLYIPLLFGSENDVLWKIMLDDAKSDAVQ